MFNWHQHTAIRELNREFSATESQIERAFWLNVIGKAAYQHDTDRLLWWRLMAIDRIIAPGSRMERRANIKIARQHFSRACREIALPIKAREGLLPHRQRLARLSIVAVRKLQAAQQRGAPVGAGFQYIDALELLFTTRLLEVQEIDGLTARECDERADDLVAAYHKALRDLLQTG